MRNQGQLTEVARIFSITNGFLVMDMQGVLQFYATLDEALTRVREIGTSTQASDSRSKDLEELKKFLDEQKVSPDN